MFDDSEWNDYPSMDAPEKASKAPKRLAELDIDRRPAPSGYLCTNTAYQLVVRGWGLLVISIDGVRLLRRTELTSAVVESFGTPWR